MEAVWLEIDRKIIKTWKFEMFENKENFDFFSIYH